MPRLLVSRNVIPIDALGRYPGFDPANADDTHVTTPALCTGVQLDQALPTSNRLGQARIDAGAYANRTNGLLKFDFLSQIPAGQQIDEAHIFLKRRFNNGDDDVTCELYRCLAAWDEGQATWNERLTGTAWNTAGATGVGTDLANPSVDEVVPIAANAAGQVWWEWDITAIAQLWYSDPASYPNHGVVMRAADSTTANHNRAFYAPNWSDDEERPELFVRYSAAVAPQPPGLRYVSEGMNGGFEQ